MHATFRFWNPFKCHFKELLFFRRDLWGSLCLFLLFVTVGSPFFDVGQRRSQVFVPLAPVEVWKRTNLCPCPEINAPAPRPRHKNPTPSPSPSLSSRFQIGLASPPCRSPQKPHSVSDKPHARLVCECDKVQTRFGGQAYLVSAEWK